MAKRSDIPAFGTLQGVRVVLAAVSAAGPFAGELFAENGADVIWIESPKGIDPYRWTNDGVGVQNEHRDMRTIMLDVTVPEGREIFLKLIEDTDIFIESSRGGQWERWGYSDDLLWEHNPRLVIGHMSGFGETGDPDYVSLSGYDHTITAFSGMMYLNGFKDSPPLLPQKFVTDYYAGLFAYGSALAGYVSAQRTGVGDSFDLAQFEVSLRCQAGLFCLWFQKQFQVERGFGAPRDAISAGSGYYECGDGEGVYLFTAGVHTTQKALEFFGLEYGSELFPEGIPSVAIESAGAPVFDAAVEAFCAKHTAAEVEEAMRGIGVPCSVVMNYKMMENHPHYLARNTWVEWDTVDGKRMKGCTSVPRWKRNDSQIWRGCPSQGMDNEDILGEIGITDEGRISELYEKGVIRKSDYVGGL